MIKSCRRGAGNVDPNLIRVQLTRWVKAGKIPQIHRGLYSIAPPFQKNSPTPSWLQITCKKHPM